MGSMLSARLIDIRDTLVPFDGGDPHMVLSFRGRRTPIVWPWARGRRLARQVDAVMLLTHNRSIAPAWFEMLSVLVVSIRSLGAPRATAS